METPMIDVLVAESYELGEREMRLGRTQYQQVRGHEWMHPDGTRLKLLSSKDLADMERKLKGCRIRNLFRVGYVPDAMLSYVRQFKESNRA